MTSPSSESSAAREVPTGHEEAPCIAIIDADSLFVDAVSPRLASLGMHVQPSPKELVNRQMKGTIDPDLVLLDGDGDDEGAAEWVLRELPNAKHILMSSELDEHDVRRAIQQGFHGAISKDISIHRFQSAILAVMHGDVVVEVKPVRRGCLSNEEDAARVLSVSLTDREREVLALLVEGASGSVMARRLSLSPHTIRTHVQNIMSKLQVHSRVEAASFAVRHGIVEPSDATSLNRSA